MSILFLLHISIIFIFLFGVLYFIERKKSLPLLPLGQCLAPLVCVLDGIFNLHETGAKAYVLFFMGLTLTLFYASRFVMNWQQNTTPQNLADKKSYLYHCFISLIWTAPFWYTFARGIETWNVFSILGLIVFILGALLIVAGQFSVDLRNVFKNYFEQSKYFIFLREQSSWWPFGILFLGIGIWFMAFLGPHDLWLAISPLIVLIQSFSEPKKNDTQVQC